MHQGDSMPSTVISDIPEVHGSNYQTHAEIIPCITPADTVCLRFSSVWTGAKNPTAPQVKAEFFLDSQALHRLVDLLLGKEIK